MTAVEFVYTEFLRCVYVNKHTFGEHKYCLVDGRFPNCRCIDEHYQVTSLIVSMFAFDSWR